MAKQKIVPYLWYDKDAEKAAKMYVDMFNKNPFKKKESKILHITRYTKAGHNIHKQKEGSVMTVEFELQGQKFVALNGGPLFKFSESISFMISCDSQQELDYFWKKLSADPRAEVCGWCKDKFGLSWQIVPSVLDKMMKDRDKEKVMRVTNAFMKMKKMDIDVLKKAYAGK